MSDKLLNINDVAAMLAVKRWSVYRYIRDLNFPKPIRIGRSNRWQEQAVKDWIEALPVSGERVQ